MECSDKDSLISEKNKREFKEIIDEQEKCYNYTVKHFSNGYKKIRIKYQSNSIEKIWFNNFIEDNIEIIVSGNGNINYYLVEDNIIDELKFKTRNIIELNLKETKYNKTYIIKKLKEEILQLEPVFIKEIVLSFIENLL